MHSAFFHGKNPQNFQQALKKNENQKPFFFSYFSNSFFLYHSANWTKEKYIRTLKTLQLLFNEVSTEQQSIAKKLISLIKEL